ncbi:hypothetical protein ACHWQZ_G000234 [Mnemiopsis leidyi]
MNSLIESIQVVGLNRNENLQDHWVHKNIFCKSSCERFAQRKAGEDRCGCGRKKTDHTNTALAKGEQNQEPWNKITDCKDVPTTAYGKINFVVEDTDQSPDFVRISDSMCETDEGLNQVINLMTLEELWGMDEHKEPNLLISVTGGAKDFDVPYDLRKNFSKGLCVAAKSSNAWIVTGGTDTGVMKMVGEAVYGYPGEIVTIGIATWGIVRGKSQLVRSDSKTKARGASAAFDYDATLDHGEVAGASLNPHHSHFIFVDDGTVGKFGGEMNFRAKLERKIAQTYPIEKTASQKEIPIIQVILNGGPNSALTCLLSMRQNIPLLVIKGSGHCADVIARAYSCSDSESGRRTLSEHGKRLVEEEINKFFPNLSEKVKKNILGYVKEIIQMDHLLTIYSLESKDLDHALLFALIKSKTDNNSSIEQMSMAINWNRKELAEEILKMETIHFTENQIEDCMEQAILCDRKDFVEMLLPLVDMKSFLSFDRLENMFRYKPEGYTHMGKKRFFKALERLVPGIKSRNDATIRDIGTFIVKIVAGGFKNPLSKVDYNIPPTNPYDLLMIYCVLNDCSEMADLLWGYTYSPISTALICFRIYKFHADYTCSLTAYDQDSEAFCLEQSRKYEEYACKSLTRCPKIFDKNDTHLLLDTSHGFWGGHTLLDIATMVGSDKFLAHGAVQNYLTEVWMGEIKSSESYLKVLCLSWFMFPLFLKYEDRERTREEIQQLLILETSGRSQRFSTGHDHEMQMLNGSGKKKEKTTKKATRDSLESKRKYSLNWYQKMFACYSSPLVKFQWNVFWYLVFIVIYTYLLVVDHKQLCAISSSSSITLLEIYCFLFVVGTLPTEILQLVKGPASNPIAKVIYHFSSFFNCVDGIAMFTYMVSFLIRVTTKPEYNSEYQIGNKSECEHFIPTVRTFYYEDFNALNVGHILNVVSFMFYVIRAMDFFKLSAEMGPKVIMIFEMIKDLFFFILILMLFVLAYSIGAQSIIRPNKDLPPKNKDYLFHLIIYRPYLMAMGEFGIEEFVEDFMIDHCKADPKENSTLDCEDVMGVLSANNIASVHYYFFVALTVIYIMVANILLVNLLIAIFSNTYERLQDNSQELYLVQRAYMIMDFKNRTILPNPFSLPEHCWIAGSWVYRKCCRAEIQGTVIDVDYRKMMKIERSCADEFATHREEEDAGFVTDTLKDLKQGIISVKNILNNASFGGAAHRGSNSELDERENSLAESQVELPQDHSLCTMRQKVQLAEKFSKFAASSVAVFKQVAVSERPMEIHTDSRTSPYPKTEIQRTPILDNQVPWKVSWPDYLPVDYTKDRPEDINLHHHDDRTLSVSLIKSFNKQKDGINRKSYLGVYDLDPQGRPLNPRGRTGLTGRGNLKRWGPNHQGDVIVSRWQMDKTGKPVHHPDDGRQILEFVATRKQGQWAIPGGRIIEGEKLVDTLEREFSEEALGSLDMTEEKRKECMAMVEKHFGLGINVYKGYVDDPSNTDNAWYETTALNYHDSDGSSFANFPLDQLGTTEDNKRARWITLDHNIDLYANHENIIEKVCFHRNAYCPFTEDVDTVDVNSGKTLKKKKSSRWGFFVDPKSMVDVNEPEE